MPHIVENRASMHITTGCGGIQLIIVLLYSNGTTKKKKHVNLKTNGSK